MKDIFLSPSVKWMEIGYLNIYSDSWATAQTSYDGFSDPVVFLSVPVTSGTIDSAAPISLRVKNTQVVSGTFSFEAKSYSVNDSFCTYVGLYTPGQLLLPSVYVSYMVAEKGFFNISGHGFSINSDTITRATEAPSDSANKIKSFNKGCNGIANRRCGWPGFFDVSGLASIAQLQTTRVDRYLLLRGFVALKSAVVYYLVPHDSLNAANYQIPAPGEIYAFMVFEKGMEIGCREDIVVKSFIPSLTSNILTLSYENPSYPFALPPAVFGLIGSLNGLDSSSIRSSRIGTGSIDLLIQEDKCSNIANEHTGAELGAVLVFGQIVRGPQGCIQCGISHHFPVSVAGDSVADIDVAGINSLTVLSARENSYELAYMIFLGCVFIAAIFISLALWWRCSKVSDRFRKKLGSVSSVSNPGQMV